MATNDFDVIVVGAGISGLNAAYRLQKNCPDRTFTLLESRDKLGGTWSFFKYPGLRSDSDLHTFGFPWRPWTGLQAIADGPAIERYINESVSVEGIDKKIQYHHKVKNADWSSDAQRWRLTVDVSGKQKTMYCNFLLFGTGYYDYENPLQTVIPGIDNFQGQTVHPQFWPEKFEYEGKKIVIIGSGATAVTLLPNLAEKAKLVTMLQRSPSYVLARPQKDNFANFVTMVLPATWAHKLIRIKYLVVPYLFFRFCRAYPLAARGLLRKVTIRDLPSNVPHDPHFSPSYNPWEQRLCASPDGDFFKCLHAGTAAVATGHIKTVTEHGITLESGQKLDADIIITATGLKMHIAGGAAITVDGQAFRPGDKYIWKGSMLQDLPNSALIVGYTNASWTLGADATAQQVCRMLNYMTKNNYTSTIPKMDDRKAMQDSPLMNMSSTYITKALQDLPKAGDSAPWTGRTNYFYDIWTAKFGNITDSLQFSRVSTK